MNALVVVTMLQIQDVGNVAPTWQSLVRAYLHKLGNQDIQKQIKKNERMISKLSFI